MNPIYQKRDNLLKIVNSIRFILADEIRKERKWIIEANRQQLLKGQRSDGKDMPEYVEGSKAPSAPGLITLFDSGEFLDSIDSLFNDEGITFESDDKKAVFLLAKYGKEVLGLNEENIRELQRRVLPRIRARIASML